MANTKVQILPPTFPPSLENISIIVDYILAKIGGNDIKVVQSTGTSLNDVMSQDGVTRELDKRVSKEFKLNKKPLAGGSLDLTAADLNTLTSAEIANKYQPKGSYLNTNTSGNSPVFTYDAGKHGYLSWNEGGKRVGYIGFVSDGVTDFTISNEKDGGRLVINKGGLKFNDANVLTTLNAYDKSVSDSRFQPKGSYATTDRFAVSGTETRMFTGNKTHYFFVNDSYNSGFFKDGQGYVWGFNASGQMTFGLIPVANGGTGAKDAANARKNLDVYSKGEVEGIFAKRADVYSIAASDGKYQPKGNYATTGASYTKAESDGKYQPKGNYQAAGSSYTKAESDSRYFAKGGGTINGGTTVSGNFTATGNIQGNGSLKANNGIRTNMAQGNWLSMRTNQCFSLDNAVGNGSASPAVRQEHGDRHWILGGLGGTQFGIYMFNKNQTANAANAAAYLTSGGNWYCTGEMDATDVNIRSDIRFKENIQRLENALAKVQSLRGYTYDVSNDRGVFKPSAGIIAQEVIKVLPNSVTADEDGYLRVSNNGLIGLLVEAVNELAEKVEKNQTNNI